jgi:hypothetical protein
MKKFIFIACLSTISTIFINAQTKNTSFINNSNEKVLQLSIIIPLDRLQAWELFTKDDQLTKWIAPKAHIELKSGGYILTNYNTDKDLSDSSNIQLGILSFLDKNLLVLKVKLNNTFPKNVQGEDENLQEIIQFDSVAPQKTRIISSMIGWGKGPDWEKTYNFFEKGNEWTYNELLKLFN